MVVLLTTVATFLYGTLVGWLVHWVLHRRWSGRLHRSHMNHHLIQYPPSDLMSDAYRDPGRDSSTFVFTPTIVLALAAYGYGLYRLGIGTWPLALVGFESVVVGLLHDWVHSQFHLSSTPLARTRWFRRWQVIHFRHHHNMKANLGILWFGWDRVFGTFKKGAQRGT